VTLHVPANTPGFNSIIENWSFGKILADGNCAPNVRPIGALMVDFRSFCDNVPRRVRARDLTSRTLVPYPTLLVFSTPGGRLSTR